MISSKLAIIITGLVTTLVCAQPTIRLDVQNNIGSLKGQSLVTIKVNNVENLDTYSFDVVYDTTQYILKSADIAALMININNCLQDGTRNIIPLIKKEPGVVHISATVAGDEPTGIIKDECAIGVLLFAPRLKNAGQTFLLDKVALLDNKRNRIAGVTVMNPGTGKGNQK
jgi:hypothetical protein